MRWFCGCLGHAGAERPSPKLAGAVESDGTFAGPHVVVKTVMQAELLPATISDVREDKDQGNAPPLHPESTPLAPQRLTNSQLMTWSPGQVSLDMNSLSRHPSITDMQKQERTLRALLDRINKFGNHSSPTISSVNSGRASSAFANSSGQLPKMYDPEVSRLNQQILKCTSTQRPGTEAYDRAAQLLQDLRSWLLSSKQEGSAAVLLFGAGEALAHSEHMARSAGQVRFWSAPVVRQFVALLQVYAALMDRCMPAASAPGGAAAAPSERGAHLQHGDELPDHRGAPAPDLGGRAGHMLAVGEGLPSGAEAAPCAGSWRQLLATTLVQLLVRANLLELLCEVLELVHLDAEFEAKSQRHEAVGAAICVLDFMRGLVGFAGAQLGVVDEKSLGHCLHVLADLVSPSRGLLPRVLQQPLLAENMTVQLHTLFLLQQLFDTPPAVLQQLLTPAAARRAASRTACAAAPAGPSARPPQAAPADDVAAFYIGHHLTEASRCYFASNGNPASAFAEMCMLHVRLLRSLGRGTTGISGPRLQLNNLLLSELAAEYGASQAAAAAAAAADGSGFGSGSLPAPDSDAEDSDRSSTPKARSGAPGSDSPPVTAAGSAGTEKGGLSGAASSKFEFTYDLNEDLERILELEEKLGEAVEVSGFEYDQEGRQLLHRNSVMAAEAEAAKGDDASCGRQDAVSEGGRPAVPKLSFSSFTRSALSSSRSLAAGASGSAREPPPPPEPAAPAPGDPAPAPCGPAPPPPSSPTAAAAHLQQQLGSGHRYHSPSRFSVGIRARSRSSSSAAADARTGTPSASVHFEGGGGGAAPSVSAPLRAPGPLVPMLDLSGLGASGKSLGNTRRSSAMNTAGGSGGGAPSSGSNAGERRHIPDSATDAGGKVDSKHCQAVATCTTGALKSNELAAASAAAATKPDSALPDLSCRVSLAEGPPAGAGAGSDGGAPPQRLLFRDPKLHALLLGSALDVSVTPAGGLDPCFWHQYPLDNGLAYNLEYLLTWHLNSGAGAAAVPELRRKLELGGGGGGKVATARGRLLRLLAKQLFDGGRYSELKFLARGAFSTVFRAKARGAAAGAPQQQVIIKSVPLPASCFDRCVLPDVYSEVAIMDQYKGCLGICQLLDYGLTDEAFWIVMRRYRCSLAEWRQRQTLSPANAAAAALYLSILLQVVAALKLLARDSVVHFDLKCQNVLIDPSAGTKDSELWNPLGAGASGLPPLAPSGSESGRRRPPPPPPFQAVLADFGEARSYRSAGEAFTVRIRGTEVYKSPEMLLMNQQAAELPPPAAGPVAAARAALQGAGLASDVWSLGCLAFELLSGKVLFGGDYASVTHRVAFGGRGNLGLNAEERAALGNRPKLVALIEWVLARDPAKRPSLDEIEARVREVQEEIWRGLAPGPAANEAAPLAAAAASS